MRYPNVPSLLIVKFLASVPSVSNQMQVASACVFLWLVLPLCIVRWAFLAILSSQTSCHSFYLSTSDALVVVIVMMQAMMRSIFALIAIERYKMTPSVQGNVLSFMGIVVALCQATLIGWATSRFSENTIIKSSVVLLFVSFLGFAFTSTPLQLCAILVPMMAGGTLLQNVNTAQLTKSVPSEDSGTIIAVDMVSIHNTALSILVPSPHESGDTNAR